MSLNYQDKLEIQELSNRYANTLDNNDIDSWLDTWSDDGVWEGRIGKYEGKTALVKLIEDLGIPGQKNRHVMSNFVIDGKDNEAKQTCYLFVFERESSTRLIASGVYTDILKKINGVWKFAHRSIKLDPSFSAKV